MNELKTDCTQYDEQELSLLVMNEECHYLNFMRQIRTRCTFAGYVELYIDPYFIYSADQLDELEDTYKEEIEEYYNS